MWLVHSSAIDEIIRLEEKRLEASLDPAQVNPGVTESRHRFNQSHDNGQPEILNISGNIAQIEISGVLTKNPSFFFSFFSGGGSTSYSEIVDAIGIAEADESVDEIELFIDSPGGRLDGMEDAINAIRETEKPIIAIVDGNAASAGFAIAAAADKIFATRKTDMIGSIGVVQSRFVSDRIIEITNRESPDKRPDVTTPEGVSVVQDELDAVHNLIIEGIAEGRSAATGRDITPDVINADFGKGAMFVAVDAKKKGLIDDFLETSGNSVNNENSSSNNSENLTIGETMNAADLKLKFPEVHAAILAEGNAAGVTAGIAKERDRCEAHLKGGVMSGNMELATKCISDGTELTNSINMDYLSGAANKSSAAARSDDNPDLGDAAQAAAKTKEDKAAEDLDDKVAASLGYQEETAA